MLLFAEVDLLCLTVTGYGFVDFETAHAAELAVKALQANGVQAQMAKVRVHVCCVYYHRSKCLLCALIVNCSVDFTLGFVYQSAAV